MRRLPGVVLAAMLAAAACTSPRIAEDSAAACSNGLDDDGDARIDCGDPKCVAGGFCEATAEACDNGLDDDDNGRIDCEDPTCVAAGFCAPRDADCGVDPQTGCPHGLVCSANPLETNGTSCALPGTTALLQPCTGRGSCRPGLHCNVFCHQVCRTESDCPRETFCVRTATTKFGTCSVACIPALHGDGCPNGSCVTSHSFELRFDDLDTGAICADRVAWVGLAAEGEKCDDPPAIARLSGMCAPSLVCYPSPDGTPRCRSTCGLEADGHVLVECANRAHHCAPAFPLDHRQPLEQQLLLGICAP